MEALRHLERPPHPATLARTGNCGRQQGPLGPAPVSRTSTRPTSSRETSSSSHWLATSLIRSTTPLGRSHRPLRYSSPSRRTPPTRGLTALPPRFQASAGSESHFSGDLQFLIMERKPADSPTGSLSQHGRGTARRHGRSRSAPAWTFAATPRVS